MEKYLPLLALFFDTIIGDPRSKYHPVALLGNLIAFLEKYLRKATNSALQQNLAGAMLVLLTLFISYAAVWLLIKAAVYFGQTGQLVCSAVILSLAISPRSLAEAGLELKGFLEAGDFAAARFKVGWIVGRDTQELDTPEITRATVETVAENIVDGIISPLFYFMIGGVPLAFMYRAVNTLDSMVGYKSEKYLHFGMVAARVDDVFNYLPARLTGFFLVIAAFILRYNAKRAIQMIWRDAGKHPSPNSGFAEAGVAGALGVRLGGLNYYGGIAHNRAFMGDALEILQPKHIKKTIYLMYAVTLFGVFGLMLLSAIF
ncbi:MAG: adenosylcobinamide-phosphate synthase CbiB [Pelosinus sp.]|nr:adenosylcobinamide-phosphate synthase CbiB [Pelosinus sp.]